MSNYKQSAPTSLRIKPSVNQVWEDIASRLGVSKVAVFEMLVYQEAARMGLIMNRVQPDAEHGATIPSLEDHPDPSLGHKDLHEAIRAFLVTTENAADSAGENAVIKLVEGLTTIIQCKNSFNGTTPRGKSSPTQSMFPMVAETKAPYQTEPPTPKPNRGRGRPRKSDGAGGAVHTHMNGSTASAGQVGQEQMEKAMVK